MRTTLNLDPAVVDEIMQLTGSRNRSEAIRLALSDYIRLQKKQQVLALRGELPLEDSWQALRQIDSAD